MHDTCTAVFTVRTRSGHCHVLCACTGHERGRLCKRSEAKAEAEDKAETDAKAEAKVIVTRPRLAVFVYSSGSTDVLGPVSYTHLTLPTNREV